ncbi:MAG: hypothetical protein K9N48_00540 [Verrucomicrobia bacterium]|nr:hypothetical protein [Verrucomicrobiota bacterium]MCF7707762.1 hypothetical protein [Verrucomicrobiota bacterium]
MKKKNQCIAIGVLVLACAYSGVSAKEASSGSEAAASAERRLAGYRAELERFREEFGGTRELPDVDFFLFGMGPRTKLLYKDGVLLEPITGKRLAKWPVASECIVPPDYSVFITTTDNETVRIFEDKRGVWIEDADGDVCVVDGTRHLLNLPLFRDNRYPQVLRVLHQELLVNVINGKPVPNYFVYSKPWYRDAAMMALCLRATGNIDVIRDWILELDEVFDRNNAGETEADNLGQVLFLVSMVSDTNHPLVPRVLEQARRFETEGENGTYIRGRTDFSEHPVYQTKWLKYGLTALGLRDPYVAPMIEDSYSALFWMDYKDAYVAGGDADNRGNYPYLGWACDHFHGLKRSPISNRDYPLTWEKRASQADYEGIRPVSDRYVSESLAAPHTWHASEVFLYLLDADDESEASSSLE